MTTAATCAIDEAPSWLAVTDSYEYDAFGNSFTVSGSTPNNYLYRGEQWDPDLGLYSHRARYYNPLTGRFMGRDPNDGNQLDPKSLHKYLYADGDPVNGTDPRGREDLLEYAGELLHFYHAVIELARLGRGIGQCASNAFNAITQDINAALLGEPFPVDPHAAVQALVACAGDAIADLIKGPWGLVWQ